MEPKASIDNTQTNKLKNLDKTTLLKSHPTAHSEEKFLFTFERGGALLSKVKTQMQPETLD